MALQLKFPETSPGCAETGLAQVSGNIYLSLASRYRLDVYYTEHFSLWLDMRIFIRTAGVMLAGEKRYLNKPLVKL